MTTAAKSAGIPVHFVDTTLRDGSQSLWAGSMRTDMLLPVVERIDQAGFQSMEIIGASFFKKMVRDLKDDPWERLRSVNALVRNTRLRAILGRHTSGFSFTPEAVSQLYLERLFVYGVREMRISDSSNTPFYWKKRVSDAKRVGLGAVLNLIYSISPLHTDDYYRKLTREAIKLPIDRLCLKDPGGLLTPERTRVLAKIVAHEARHVPVEFHTHCNTGLGPLAVLEAIKAGITIINTAIPPLANGSSNPSIFNVAENAAALGYAPQIDLDVLRPVAAHFNDVARRAGFPVGVPLEYTESHYTHQVPGGMISNLRHQLTQMKLLDKLPAVLEEIVRVRQDLGYPIMVTPYSQFVGVQATLNVIAGERYKQLTDEIVQYAMGLWGDVERDAIEPNLRDRILASPRARELAGWTPPEPTVDEMRQVLGGPSLSDDELLLRYFAGAHAVEAMRNAPPRSEYTVDGRRPLVELVRELANKPGMSQVRIEKKGLLLHMS